MKIVVLCGGLSTERKISFSSGTQICKALRQKGHQAVLVDLFLGLEGEREEIRKNPAQLFEELPSLKEVVFDGNAPDLEALKKGRKLQSPSLFGEGVLEICQAAELVFIALHGMNGEDGRVQAAFDLFGIPYTGSGYLGAAMAMDKTVTKHMIAGLGLKTPGWKEYHHVKEEDAGEIAAENAVPCVVKTPTGGSSLGMHIVKEQADLEDAVRDVLRYGSDILVEEFIEGREFTCGVLEGRALPSVEIVPKTRFYDYQNKYQAGATEEICPGRCSAEVEKKMGEDALAAHKALRLKTYSRSDFIVTEEDEVYFLEVNTLPGMTPTSLVPQEAAQVGISFEDLCESIVKDALAKEA